MNSYDDKIMMIKENQKKLLILAKNKIEEESNIFNFNARNIVDVLNHDSMVVKKYEAVVEAQKLIQEYTSEILNSTSVEEIVEIRKKLNKCINKIKKEMQNRGIDDYEYNKYCDEAARLRKTISMNVRFLKREDKINEMEDLNNNVDSLSEEDELRLKKLVKNELSYGKRNLEKNSYVDEQKSILKEEIKIEKNMSKEFTLPKMERTSTNIIESFDSLEDFLDCRVNDMETRYKVSKIANYDGGIIKNLRIFMHNLSKIRNNNKIVSRMNAEYNLFIRKPELLGYSDYVSSYNKVGLNLKKALKNGILKNKEIEYADEHQKIVEWIIDYCQKKNLEIRYNKRMEA